MKNKYPLLTSDTRSGIIVAFMGRLSSPGGGLTKMHKHSEVAVERLDQVIGHGSRAQWKKTGRWEQPLGEMEGKRFS